MLHVVAAATIRATSTGLARAVTTTTAAVFTGSFDGFFRAEVVTLVDPNLNIHDGLRGTTRHGRCQRR